ncbi:MAG: Uma2 family endonuclease [Planctomycetota bacterium]|nr:Uma2 family endonuclease [Planctomycetota bacterium]
MSSVINITHVTYPESDGKPMGETDEHREEMVEHIQVLQDFYQGQRVYVSGNLLVYHEQGNPRRFVVPDAFVAKGLAPKKRRVYKTWIEGKAPDVVIETTSKKTRRKDTLDKPELYAQLGVKEYFLFDPTQDYLDPPLQGHRLVGDSYVRIEPDSAGGLESEELGLRLVMVENRLRFYRRDTGEMLLTRTERAEREVRARREETERANREAQARQEETARADREAQARREETERADREAESRRAAEAELARLRAELARRASPEAPATSRSV